MAAKENNHPIQNLEDLYTKLAMCLAACKTPKDQQDLLSQMLRALNNTEHLVDPVLSTSDEKEILQTQLVRNAQFRFINCAKSMPDTLITPNVVAQKDFQLTRNHRDNFREGWDSQVEQDKTPKPR
jgi:hypothetical protein